MIGGKGFQCNMRMNPNCLGGSLNASQYVDETASSKIPNFLRAVCAGGGGPVKEGARQASGCQRCLLHFQLGDFIDNDAALVSYFDAGAALL